MLVRHRNPTAEAFYLWMNEYPESTHWCDTGRFHVFVNTAIACGARKWLDTSWLEEKILSIKPKFDEERLNDLLIAMEHIRDARKAGKIRSVTIEKRTTDAPRDSFKEVRVDENGKWSEKWILMNNH